MPQFNYYGELDDFNVSDEEAYNFVKDTVARLADDIYSYDYLELGEDDVNTYALLVGWMDGFDPEDCGNEEGRDLCIQVGYLPKRTTMADFEDWYMPYNPDTYDVWDTNVPISQDPAGVSLSDVKWEMDSWRRYVKIYNKITRYYQDEESDDEDYDDED